MQNKILITIDRNLIYEYMQYYFKQKPKARTFPFASNITEKQFNKDGTPKLTKGGKQATKSRSRTKAEITIDNLDYGVMSLNELLVIPDRFMMNGLKEKWGDLGEWIAKHYDIQGKMYSDAVVEFRIYGATKANRDLDNISAGIKFLNDGLFVKSEAFVDDNYNHINPLITVGDYDKDNPRTEIRISLIENGEKDIYKRIKQHIYNWKN